MVAYEAAYNIYLDYRPKEERASNKNYGALNTREDEFYTPPC